MRNRQRCHRLDLVGAGANMSIYVDVESDHGTDGAVVLDFAVRVHFGTLVCCVIVFVFSNHALIASQTHSVARVQRRLPAPAYVMAFFQRRLAAAT